MKSLLEGVNRNNASRFFLLVFTLCTLVSAFYAAIPVYAQPSIAVESEPVPEYEFNMTNDTWYRPERILLANLTPQLEDPSWYSTEWKQRKNDARIETDNISSTLFFYNQTAENETYTWNDYARWSLIWPFDILNYTELTAEWHIKVIRGNITVESSFRIDRGFNWDYGRGSRIDGSTTEMNGSAGDAITLMSSVSNFTEEFSTIDVGILWIDLSILAAQGSIVTVENVEVWINTDDPICSVTLDFQTLYGQSLFTDSSIVSQWLGSAYSFDYSDSIGARLSFFMKRISSSLPYGFDLMLGTRSNQTAYLSPGYQSLTLGWSDHYLNDEYIFTLTLTENSSYYMQIPLPLNPIALSITPDSIPTTIRLSYGTLYWSRYYFDSLTLIDSEEILMILPNYGSLFVQLSIPGKSWAESELSITRGAYSTVVIDFKLIPLFGIYFTPQQILAICFVVLFASLSLLILVYRWRVSKNTSYPLLLPLALFTAGFLLPWSVRTDTWSNVIFSTYYSSILGYRLWQFDNLSLIIESALYSEQLQWLLSASIFMTFTLLLFIVAILIVLRFEELLFGCSIILLIGGVTLLLTVGGLPWFGFWCMLSVPFLTYLIHLKSLKQNKDQDV